jgi:hypothetical protein
MKTRGRSLFIVSFLFFLHFSLSSQTIVRGFVRDSITGQAIVSALIKFEGQKKTVSSASSGYFEVQDTASVQYIIVLQENYQEKKLFVTINQINVFDILLSPQVEYLRNRQQQDSLPNAANYPAILLLQKMLGNRKIPTPSYRLLVFASDLLTEDYLSTHRKEEKNKFDIGPVTSFISRNDIEGVRLALGGKTTSKLNKYFYFKGLGAYGFRDQQFKYSGTATWSLNGKNPDHDYGIDALSVRYQYDIQSLNNFFSSEYQSNIFLSFKRQQEYMMRYQRSISVNYSKEFGNGMAAETWSFLNREAPAGDWQWISEDEQGNIHVTNVYKVAGVGLKLHYTKTDKPLRHGYTPNLSFSYQQGMKGFLDGDYNYQYAEFAVHKIFPVTFGLIALHAKTGKIWGDVPFPLLIIPNYNLSYGIRQGGYNLMNLLEFISDKYVSFDTETHFDGLLFNKIPLVSNLKLKEVITFSGVYGDLSSNKFPENNRTLFIFPNISSRMGKVPYMEASIGLENILGLFRVDYVRRLTYLDKPGISKGGCRFSLKLLF